MLDHLCSRRMPGWGIHVLSSLQQLLLKFSVIAICCRQRFSAVLAKCFREDTGVSTWKISTWKCLKLPSLKKKFCFFIWCAPFLFKSKILHFFYLNSRSVRACEIQLLFSLQLAGLVHICSTAEELNVHSLAHSALVRRSLSYSEWSKMECWSGEHGVLPCAGGDLGTECLCCCSWPSWACQHWEAALGRRQGPGRNAGGVVVCPVKSPEML